MSGYQGRLSHSCKIKLQTYLTLFCVTVTQYKLDSSPLCYFSLLYVTRYQVISCVMLYKIV